MPYRLATPQSASVMCPAVPARNWPGRERSPINIMSGCPPTSNRTLRATAAAKAGRRGQTGLFLRALGAPSIYGTSARRSVAQPGSAPASGAGGRRFKSCHSDQIFPYSWDVFHRAASKPRPHAYLWESRAGETPWTQGFLSCRDLFNHWIALEPERSVCLMFNTLRKVDFGIGRGALKSSLAAAFSKSGNQTRP